MNKKTMNKKLDPRIRAKTSKMKKNVPRLIEVLPKFTKMFRD